MANYQAQARRFARKFGIDPDVFVRQIRQESGFRPHVTSPAGARGIAQIMPATAQGWGVNPDNPTAALKAAAKHMAQYVRQYGNYRDALVAYNAGPGAVGGHLPAETQRYVANILNGRNPSPGAAKTSGGSTTRTTTTTTSLTPEAEQGRRAALAQFVLSNHPDPVNLAQTYAALGQQTQTTSRVRTTHTPGSQSSPAAPTATGTANFEGHKVAAWIAPILTYARQHGWKGQVNSGFRSFAEQTRIYNSGVRPAAKPGTSNHEGTQFPRGAVDVTDAAQLSAILRRSPYARRLVYAGAKDPVHFSHPHNGSY